MTWVYSIPVWLFAPLVIATLGFIAGAGVVIVRQRFRLHDDQVPHNDVAGPIIGIVGTVLAVMLSFMVVTEWQEFDNAASGVQTEASAVIDMYHLAEHLPKATSSEITHALDQYVDRVVNDEWPRMRQGEPSAAAHQSVYRLAKVLSAFEPTTPGQRAIQEQELIMARTLADARRQRLFSNEQSVPPLLWFTLLFLGAVTIAFCWFFRVKNQAVHVAMTVSLAAVIGMMFVLIAEFDLPFRGDIRVTPAPFRHAHDVVRGIEPQQ